MINTFSAASSPDLDQVCCAVCQHDSVFDFYHSLNSPAHIGVVYATRDAALRAKRGNVLLAHCPKCNMIRNRDAGRGGLAFEPGFEVQLTHSPTFRAFLAGVAERLIAAHRLHGKDLLDAGCGAGDFLRLLCEKGGNRGLGIDPAVAQDGFVPLTAGAMELRRDDFGTMALDRSFDFAVSQSVLEVVPDPVAFLRKMRDRVVSRRGRIYVETFNGARAIQQGETWSVCYELCNYFVLDSLVHAAQRAGLRVLDAGYCYGRDQYLYLEAEAEPSWTSPSPSPASAIADNVAAFRKSHERSLHIWRQRVSRLRESRQRAVVWGSGGKGISFLNAIDAADVFPAVIDINPLRQGKYIPGTGHQIVAPDWLASQRPEVIVISNPLYEQEIRSMAGEVGVDCEFEVL